MARNQKPTVGAASTGTVRDQIAEDTGHAKEALASKVAAADQGKKEGHTVFVSQHEEPQTYDIRLDHNTVVRGYWDSAEERVLWRVPDKLLERFQRHSFLTSGRVIKAS